MILHIGWDSCVRMEDVLCILQGGLPRTAGDAAGFLATAKREGRFIPCPEGERAYVVTLENGRCLVYASAISALTLCRRLRADGREICKTI